MIVLDGCGAERLAAFDTGEEIPLRVIGLTVHDREIVPGSRPPLSSLSAPQGERAIAVFVRWSGLEEMQTLDTRNLIETILEHRLTLIDRSGTEYSPVKAMPRDFFYGSSYTLDSPPDWVVVFHVAIEGDEYILHVEHADPGDDDFQVSAVTLD